MDFEVIVVGAGPAGSTAAILLAQKGRKVLLLDSQSFPREKVCGDGIPPGTMQILYDLGLRDKINLAELYPINGMRFMTPGGQILDTNFKSKTNNDFYIVPRLKFDYLLQQHAIKSGAKFREARVNNVLWDNGRVIGVRAIIGGEQEDIFAQVVIGADGATSTIARNLCKRKPGNIHRLVAVRAYIEGIEILPNRVEFYWQRDLLPGYAWIFPLGENCANIGLGIPAEKFHREQRNLKELLTDFLALPEIKQRLRDGWQLRNSATWPLNLASGKKIQRAYDGALLVGDAAYFVDPLSGEGIRNAMLSAQIAADVVDDAFRRGDVSLNTLSAYEKNCQKTLWKIIRRSIIIQRTLLYVPFLTDLLAKGAKKYREFFQKLFTKISTDFSFYEQDIS